MSEQEPRIGVFVCKCGTNIAKVVDVPAVAEYAKDLPHVAYSGWQLFTCSEEGQTIIKDRIKEHNLPRDAYEWYLDLRKYGSVPHSGFGLGIERTLSWICKIKHIRETIPFPRLLYKIYP